VFLPLQFRPTDEVDYETAMILGFVMISALMYISRDGNLSRLRHGPSYSSPPGWNLLSTVCPPPDPVIPEVWSEVVDHGNLYITKNQDGEFYRPGVFNGMVPWDVKQGYKAKLVWADTLVIINVPIDVSTPIPLSQGGIWWLISLRRILMFVMR